MSRGASPRDGPSGAAERAAGGVAAKGGAGARGAGALRPRGRDLDRHRAPRAPSGPIEEAIARALQLHRAGKDAQAEQAARQAQEVRVEALQGLLAEEDVARRRMASEAFKALAQEARQQERDALARLRERIKVEQQSLQAARAALLAQREQLARYGKAIRDNGIKAD